MKEKASILCRILLLGIITCTAIQQIYCQEGTSTELQQYLFPAFSKSRVRTKAGKDLNIILNYNMVSEKMVFEQGGEYYDLTNPEQVDTAYIQSRKFVTHGKEFVEFAVAGVFPFYIQHKADLQPPPRPGAYGTTSELTSSNYLSGYQTDMGYYNFKLPAGYTVKKSTFYWIIKGEEWLKINSEKQVAKLFPENEDQIKSFIKTNRIKADRPDDMVKLVHFINGLSK